MSEAEARLLAYQHNADHHGGADIQSDEGADIVKLTYLVRLSTADACNRSARPYGVGAALMALGLCVWAAAMNPASGPFLLFFGLLFALVGCGAMAATRRGAACGILMCPDPILECLRAALEEEEGDD